MRPIGCWHMFSLASVALAGLALTSCSRSAAFYPVEGEVFFEGEPATGALVVLHPTENAAPAAVRPSGYVDAQGNVKLTSYLAPSRSYRNGAPAGEYIVTISWLPMDVKEYLSKRPNAPLPDKLQGRYSQPQNSSLRAKVLERPTELPRIDLKKEGAIVAVTPNAVSFSSHSFTRQSHANAGGSIHD